MRTATLPRDTGPSVGAIGVVKDGLAERQGPCKLRNQKKPVKDTQVGWIKYRRIKAKRLRCPHGRAVCKASEIDDNGEG